MSALIVTASPPARSTPASPGTVGGSAEDFAAAIRDAAPDAHERPEPASDREQSATSTADAGIAAMPPSAVGDALDGARTDLPPARLGVRDGAVAAADPAHADSATAEDGTAVGLVQPLTQARLSAEEQGLLAARGRAGLLPGASGAVEAPQDAAADASVPGEPQRAAVPPASAGGTAVAAAAAEGATSRPAQAAVADQPIRAASGAVRAADGTAASQPAAPVDAQRSASGQTPVGAQPAAGAERAPDAQAAPGTGVSTGARIVPSTPTTHEPPHAPRAAESLVAVSQPVASAAPAAAASAAEPAPTASTRPALLPQVASPVLALARYPQGQHSITLTVAPENLGPVTVRAHISGSSIRLELHSPSDAGREALRVILADLRRDLSVAAPGASVDVSSRDTASGSSPDPQGRSDPQGRFETSGRSEAQPRGDQQSRRPGETAAAPGANPASAADIQPPTPAHSSAQSRIDVYA
ncbi:flagellar hook-length control protein FliK [Microbacterium sp. NPDC089321]|uniref:flagellar hook-length control protein FliK n=1 Tax=Microbacterium sp. NPDC089321 TaxID=3155183 RepID=UPI00341B933D